MNLVQAVLFFLGALGAFNGFLLSFYLLLKKKNRTLQKVLLGFLLLMLSIQIFNSVVLFFFCKQLDRTIHQIELSSIFFIGPLLLIFISTSLRNQNVLPKPWKIFLVSLTVCTIIGGILFPYRTNFYLWRHNIAWFVYSTWLLFIFLAVIDYLKQSKKEKLIGVNYSLITWILVGNVVIALLFILSFVQCIRNTYITGGFFFTVAFYLTFYQSFKEKTITTKTEPGKYKDKKIVDDEALLLITKLEKTVVENELYKNPDIKIGDIAARIKISSHQLSQLLNDNMQKSFATFINEYRIKEACHKIITEPHIKIEEIGYEVGFNSKSTFFTAFKKIINSTPTSYRNKMQLDTSNDSSDL
jgi:AraC-like DNA-binding protein